MSSGLYNPSEVLTSRFYRYLQSKEISGQSAKCPEKAVSADTPWFKPIPLYPTRSSWIPSKEPNDLPFCPFNIKINTSYVLRPSLRFMENLLRERRVGYSDYLLCITYPIKINDKYDFSIVEVQFGITGNVIEKDFTLLEAANRELYEETGFIGITRSNISYEDRIKRRGRNVRVVTYHTNVLSLKYETEEKEYGAERITGDKVSILVTGTLDQFKKHMSTMRLSEDIMSGYLLIPCSNLNEIFTMTD